MVLQVICSNNSGSRRQGPVMQQQHQQHCRHPLGSCLGKAFKSSSSQPQMIRLFSSSGTGSSREGSSRTVLQTKLP